MAAACQWFICAPHVSWRAFFYKECSRPPACAVERRSWRFDLSAFASWFRSTRLNHLDFEHSARGAFFTVFQSKRSGAGIACLVRVSERRPGKGRGRSLLLPHGYRSLADSLWLSLTPAPWRLGRAGHLGMDGHGSVGLGAGGAQPLCARCPRAPLKPPILKKCQLKW